MQDVLEEALRIAKYYHRTKHRVLELQLPPGLPPLRAVRDQLVQIFLNLILNAMDATGKGGHIAIDVEHRPGELLVAVRDNGSGILPEHVTRLFQPYFTTKKHGTGLGLFVTRKLVTDHGGHIEFESALGRGTTFRVGLPIEVEADNGDRKWESEPHELKTENGRNAH